MLKSPLLVQKTTTHPEENLNTTYMKSIKNFLFLFYLLLMIHRKHVFSETIQLLRGFIYYRKLCFTFGNLNLISVNTAIFVKINNKWNGIKIGILC